MWNWKSGSKITEQKMRQRSYDIHRQKVQSIKPRMKIKHPIQPQFVYTKNKLNLSRKERRIQIDKQNEILLYKMNKIKFQEYNTNKLRPQAQQLKTLNAKIINDASDQIAKENKRFCEKLLRTKSFYPTNSILTKSDKLDKVCTNISFNARRVMSAKTLERPRSGYTTFSTARKDFLSSKIDQKGFERKHYSYRPETAPYRSAQKLQSARELIRNEDTEQL